MVMGILLAIVAGALVSLQTIFNNQVNARAGSWATTTLVLGMGFIASFIASLIFEGSATFSLQNMKPWYWISGAIGVGVVFCLVQGIKRLGPTFATSIVLIAQLSTALLFDTTGWLVAQKIALTPGKIIGVLVIIVGIIVYKFGDRWVGKAARSKKPSTSHTLGQ
ncbi:DMT family transporter [Paenibacillus hunanensis]|uniref:Transporter family-2 protein n=1 Tax=Paenibacillus hunanensis TaxID=539262 RepID=A0ABU1ITX5_9BACL|nr:DMT family transporter [Paenibacillus hunanensis]MCL9661767.1 DMT family transporter [Paenibacillus hunanensis]MDR6242714.1 transporter family-2 protein [Paenibacillus hunanensis]GGJ02168.1 membrane protein [Paenibacillus hunanensis]